MNELNTTAAAPEYQLQPASHWLIQIASGLLFMSYTVTNVLYLRLLIAAASISFVMWGAFVLKYALDIILWNSAFFVINVAHVCKIMYDRRSLQFDPDREYVYEHIFFRYLNMDKLTFKHLTACCEVQNLSKGEYYAKIGSVVENLAVILEGELEVLGPSQHVTGRMLVNHLVPLEFTNAPEWTWGYDRYEVDIKCITDVRLFIWPFIAIKSLQVKDPSLRGLINGALAKDIANKLRKSQSILGTKAVSTPLTDMYLHRFLGTSPSAPRRVDKDIEIPSKVNGTSSSSKRSESKSSGSEIV